MKKNEDSSSSAYWNTKSVILSPELADALHQHYSRAMESLSIMGRILDVAEAKGHIENVMRTAFSDDMLKPRAPKIEVNPIQFDSLEDLAEYLRRKRDA